MTYSIDSVLSFSPFELMFVFRTTDLKWKTVERGFNMTTGNPTQKSNIGKSIFVQYISSGGNLQVFYLLT